MPICWHEEQTNLARTSERLLAVFLAGQVPGVQNIET